MEAQKPEQRGVTEIDHSDVFSVIEAAKRDPQSVYGGGFFLVYAECAAPYGYQPFAEPEQVKPIIPEFWQLRVVGRYVRHNGGWLREDKEQK